MNLTKFTLTFLAAVVMVSLATPTSEAGCLFRCRSSNNYSYPVAESERLAVMAKTPPVCDHVNYFPMKCIDGAWQIVKDGEHDVCLSMAFNMQPCIAIPGRGGVPTAAPVRTNRCACPEHLPMVCDRCRKCWRQARWCEKPDGILPIEYLGFPCCPPGSKTCCR